MKRAARHGARVRARAAMGGLATAGLLACGLSVDAPPTLAVDRTRPAVMAGVTPALPDEPPLRDAVPERPVDELEVGQLPNGVRVASVVRRGYPLVAAALGIARGADDGPVGAALLSTLSLVACRQEETERPCPYHVLRMIGAPPDLGFDADGTVLAATALSPLARASVRSLSRILVDPPLEGAVLDDDKQRWLLHRSDVRLSVAQLAFRKRLLGRGHASVRSYADHVDAARGSNLADVRDWRARYLRPDEITLAVVGDLSHEAALRWAQQELGGLVARGEPPPAGPSPGPARAPSGVLTLAHAPGTSQATVLVGVRAPRRDQPWPPELLLLDGVLGHGVEGRLGRSLRRAHGTTYGAAVQATWGRATGSLAVVADVETSHVLEAITTIRELFAELGRTPLGADELSIAQRRLLSEGRGLARDDLTAAARELLDLVQHGETLASRQAVARQAIAFDPEGFRRAAARWLVADEVQVVVVGDHDALAKPLAAAGYVEGRPLPRLATEPEAAPAATAASDAGAAPSPPVSGDRDSGR